MTNYTTENRLYVVVEQPDDDPELYRVTFDEEKKLHDLGGNPAIEKITYGACDTTEVLYHYKHGKLHSDDDDDRYTVFDADKYTCEVWKEGELISAESLGGPLEDTELEELAGDKHIKEVLARGIQTDER